MMGASVRWQRQYAARPSRNHTTAGLGPLFTADRSSLALGEGRGLAYRGRPRQLQTLNARVPGEPLEEPRTGGHESVPARGERWLGVADSCYLGTIRDGAGSECGASPDRAGGDAHVVGDEAGVARAEPRTMERAPSVWTESFQSTPKMRG
jgi:hypothetical protein